MPTLDFFRAPPDVLSFSHPRLRDWKRRLEQPGVGAELELYRPPTLLGSTQTELSLHFTKDGKPQPVETAPWDDDLNAGLIRLQVRAINPDQEAERFALGLRAALRQPGREFGDGYFNAVLIELLKAAGDPEIAEVIGHIGTSPPHQGNSYNTCREMIKNAIGGRVHELLDDDKLRYDENTANGILVKALARYLDERFSLSARRRMGLL
jgi:hypothetical protein